MNVKEIKKAIEELQSMYWKMSQVMSVEDLKEHNGALDLAIQALQSELEKQENKPLKFYDLETMKDKPVWRTDSNDWDVVRGICLWKDWDEHDDRDGYRVELTEECLDFEENLFYKYELDIED